MLFVLRALQLSEHLFGTIQQTGLQIVLRQFVQRSELLFRRQIGALQQVLVHADRSLDFAPPPEQAAQRKMQFDGLRIDLHDLDEGFDRLVRLLVEKEIQALEVRKRERARFGQQLLDVHPRRQPAEREEQRKSQQPPELEFHCPGQSEARCPRLQASLALHARLKALCVAGKKYRSENWASASG